MDLRFFPALSVALVLISAAGAQTLRESASNADILIGAAVNVHYLSEADYTSTLSREFNMLEPEDAMKWEVLHPAEKTFDFTDADRIVVFAATHNMRVRGHTLVWATHNPAWLLRGGYSPQQLSEMLHDHINRVAGHFRDRVFAWDVVNEAFDENGKPRDSIWSGAGKGMGYIERSFLWAHEADPQALLFYNDAGAEQLNPKSDAIYAMVKDFQQRKVPIDGIGFQMHIFDLSADSPSISANFARFAKLGMQIHITEMDVALPVTKNGSVVDRNDLQKQANIYRRIVEICLQTPGCSAIQTWGVTDKYSWLGWATNKTKGAGLLFDGKYQPKPVYEAVQHTLIHHARKPPSSQ